MRVWVRFGESPELPGVKQKRAALVAFTRKMKDATVEVRAGAWYDGRVVYTNQAVCDEGERFEEIVDATLRAIKARAGKVKMVKVSILLQQTSQQTCTHLVNTSKKVCVI